MPVTTTRTEKVCIVSLHEQGVRLFFWRSSVFSVILILSLHAVLVAAAIDLSGTVVDDAYQPISGAEVTLSTNRHLRTQSDAVGRFRILGDLSALVKPLPSGRAANGSPTGTITLYDYRGRKILELPDDPAAGQKATRGNAATIGNNLAAGVYCVVTDAGKTRRAAAIVASGGALRLPGVRGAIGNRRNGMRRAEQSTPFNDILVASATGTQTTRRVVSAAVASDITLRLMPVGASNATPGVPLVTNSGGRGDVTTYGSVSDPEASEGGACNYGATAIRYYAAINVSLLPGDLQGQWREGRVCGRCARVSVQASDGTVRTTTVRVVDKCPDDNCGIDLGGAPAGEVMGTAPGRYYGEWEWVSCDGINGVSDGPPSLHVKEGGNSWWSLVQMRNGPGAVTGMRARKAGASLWTPFSWATEAENYFSVPANLLQDGDKWDIAIEWTTGTTDTLRVRGTDLAVENALYPL